MKLINCLGKDFDDACFNLASDMISHGAIPDIIIGVATGGTHVATRVFNYMKVSNPHIKYCEVTLQRPYTLFMKNIGIKKIFKIIPKWLLDQIRIWNINIHEYFYEHINKNIKRNGNIFIPNNIKDIINEKDPIHIMFIDDAVDSGTTFELLTNFINKLHNNDNNLIITYGVLTTSYKNPKIRPNFSLYNRTILRFPWAFDAFKFNK